MDEYMYECWMVWNSFVPDESAIMLDREEALSEDEAISVATKTSERRHYEPGEEPFDRAKIVRTKKRAEELNKCLDSEFVESVQWR